MGRAQSEGGLEVMLSGKILNCMPQSTEWHSDNTSNCQFYQHRWSCRRHFHVTGQTLWRDTSPTSSPQLGLLHINISNQTKVSRCAVSEAPFEKAHRCGNVEDCRRSWRRKLIEKKKAVAETSGIQVHLFAICKSLNSIGHHVGVAAKNLENISHGNKTKWQCLTMSTMPKT